MKAILRIAAVLLLCVPLAALANGRPKKVFHLYVNDGDWELADGTKTYIVSYVAYNERFEEAPKGAPLPPPQAPSRRAPAS